MGDVSNNFSRYEFSCPCGCGFDTVDVELLEVAQRMRDHWDCRVDITPSGGACRCAQYNGSIEGHTKSRHLRGQAMDFIVDYNRISPRVVQRTLRQWYRDKYGIGKGKNFTHFDVRPYVSEWDYDD